MEQREPFIDILKGMCIIAVIFTHAGWTKELRYSLLFPFVIDMAVPFFMLISGYVYTKSFQKNEMGVGLDAIYTKRYLLKNSIRYTVPFFMAYMLECVNVFLWYRPSGVMGIKDFCKVSVFNFFLGGYGPGSYYYPEMMQITLLFPVIYVIVNRYAFRGVVFVACSTLFCELLKQPYGVSEDLYRFLLFRYFILLAFGSYFALHRMNRRMWLLSALGAVFIILFSYTDYKPRIFYWWSGTSMFPVLLVVPVFGAFSRVEKKIPLLELIGKASYNIFLTQKVYYSSYCKLYGEINKLVPQIYQRAFVSILICVPVGILFWEIEKRITYRITSRAIRLLNS